MKRTIALFLPALLACVTVVRADIIPSFDDAYAFGDTAVWNYHIDITTDQNVTTGDFFTIYDFGNFIPGSNSEPVGWSLTASYVGTTPGLVNPTDDPGLLNLTWTYNGPTILGPTLDIGTFRVTVNGPVAPTRTSQFASQATRNSGPNAGTKIDNIGNIPVPTAIPEPSVLALLAVGGAFGIGRIISRRRKA